ncbi:hypothetical protein CC78DRAFT_578737 [Lojkania enalia]|uniref:Uncharacterized protein n=1 Tax=Lojkania enalia TaxID=147567 RepID=A0A9P4KG96_9PLEO|nr:hypothetical protein CC78DRAFT_578737 [Didymosphaeria enalia]
MAPTKTLILPRLTKPARPFQFLDLPVENSLMVYERLPRTIKHTTSKTEYTIEPAQPSALDENGDVQIIDADDESADNIDASSISPARALTFIHCCTTTSILATCRIIHKEPTPIIHKTIDNWILDGGVKLIFSFDPLLYRL